MKRCSVIALIVFLLAQGSLLRAQSTNAPVKQATITKRSAGFETQLPGIGSTTTFLLRQPKPNQIVVGKIAYEGIVVEAIKTKRPLQLINPKASAQYGSPEDNVVRDPIGGRVVGLKIFSVRF